MDESGEKLRLTPQIALTCTNVLALITFACSPLAHVYPMAMIGIVAFTLVQLFLPACWVNLESPICPGNFAQFFFWVQIVLVPVLIGYFGPSLGTLSHLPPENMINFAIGLRVLGYVSFCLAYQMFSWPIHVNKQNRTTENLKPVSRETIAMIGVFAAIGLMGWWFHYGGIGGFIAYVASPEEQRLRDAESTTITGALGNILRHFFGFSIVWAWSEWVRRQNWAQSFMVILLGTACVVGMLLLANFSYNRGNMVMPILALAAAFSQHVRRVSFSVVASAGSLLLLVAFVFGEYRSTSMEISELSVSEVTSFGDQQGVVDEIQIYGAGPQLAAFILEGVESESQTQKRGTLVSSILYPVPIFGKPFRETSGVVRFNQLIYGDSENFDQNIPYDAELYMNFQAAGVILGYLLLGFTEAFLQRRFFFARQPIASYAWLTIGIWTVFPASLPVLSQICVFSFWPIYLYAFYRANFETEQNESDTVSL